MNRRKPDLQAIDVSAWPTVAYTEFDQATRNMFEKRQQAILRYVAGESIREIEKSAGINRRQLYRWLERAQEQHPDGRPFGFRGLIRYMRIADYERVRDVQVHGERGSRGAAGALAQLFERYPALAGWLLLQVNVAGYCLSRYIPTVTYELACAVCNRYTMTSCTNVGR